MKRVICAIAAALLFSAVLMPSADARLYPYGYEPIDRDSGEDHPWGGEQNNGPQPVLISSPDDQVSITGSVTLDAFMFKLFAPWIFDGLGSNYIITDRVVDDSNDGTTTSDRNRSSN